MSSNHQPSIWKKARAAIVPLIAGGFASFALYHLIFAEEHRPSLEPFAPPPQAQAADSVAGVGIVEPVTESISVGSSRAGIVLEVFHGADHVGKRVARGEPLFRVDDRDLCAEREVARSKVKSAQAALDRLLRLPREEDVPPLEAKAAAAKARVVSLRDRYDRARQIDGLAISDEEVVRRQSEYEAAQRELELAEKELALLRAGAWEPDVEIAAAALDEAKANLAQVETEIDRCLVKSPIDGEILQVRVRVGEYVNAAGGNRDLVVLGDTSVLHVRVDIDEENIPHCRLESPARAVVRGNAGKSFALSLARHEPMVIPKKTLTGDNTERVDTRVMQLIYRVDDPAADLFVGQQLDVYLAAPSERIAARR